MRREGLTLMDECLLTIYRTILLYDGKISQEKEIITVKIPQHTVPEINSFYMVYRIHIMEEKLFTKEFGK